MSPKKLKSKAIKQKTRKQLRKEERKNKKARRNEYYTNRRKPGQYILLTKNKSTKLNEVKKDAVVKPQSKANVITNKFSVEDMREREKRQQAKLQKEMSKQRNKQLLEANVEEDRNIRKLEKQLKMNKRKTKSVPASFAKDGLDYLLEVCDPEALKTSALAEQQLMETNDFEEDLDLMTHRSQTFKESKQETESDSESYQSSEDLEEKTLKRKVTDQEDTNQKKLKKKLNDSDFSDDDTTSEKSDSGSYQSAEDSDDKIVQNSDPASDSKLETWTDIYGRLRSQDGSVIQSQKYIPPAARTQSHSNSEKLERLKRQLKGLINRLAESNMHSVATQIENLYMNNSRNDMNSAITSLIVEALVSNIVAPERLLMEHVVLVVILHANVGTEVGAHFLQTVVKLFEDYLNDVDVEDKRLDNVVLILGQLYNFKLFDCKLLYEVIDKLTANFGEKSVECILHILKSVGFSLRKDNPTELKNLILVLQKKAAEVANTLKDNSRVKFMLDILLAIKNNNMTKIPNYDTSYSEHLKKILKSFIRKGNYVTELNISLEDLLKVEEKGKWWVIGSAWSGNTETVEKSLEKPSNFSQTLLDLASKQRMNTDTRKNIFCIIMSAEDYLDAFEKLLRLALKNQQEREIINVILHCCLQEKSYNPYYATLAQKFCEHDRKYQMTIKYSIWDKLKALQEHSSAQISNLAKLLIHLFVEKGLPISTLKIMQFSELDKVTLRFIRQILLGILLNEDVEVCQKVFENVSYSDKLKMFRESLRLFLHHFLLRNLDSQKIPEEKKILLQERVKIVERLLSGKEKNRF